jgi:hypothetical protein
MYRFIAIDGEGHGDRLVLLAANSANNGVQTYVENYSDDGLSTREMLDFLWGLAECYPGDKFIGFSFTYDVNMIIYPLLSLRKPMVKRLCEKKYVRAALDKTTTVGIRFYPGKFVVFTEYIGKEQGRTIRIEDTFGFYQQSFVKALDKWEMPDKQALERIAEGKKHRSDSFAAMDRTQVLNYCLDECQQLAKLTDKLRNAIKSAGIELDKYIGAGAIAQTYMRKYNVHNHVRHDNVYGSDIQEAIMYAYFGGRSEIYRQGYFRHPTYVYDINSAYPAETLTLPSLRNGLWRKYRSENKANLTNAVLSGEIPYGLCKVSWDVGELMPTLVPFPKRMANGNIRYRGKGEGWYWMAETQTALRHFPDAITVHEILAFDPRDNTQPFAFVEHLAAMRLQAKQAGLASAQIYKLGLNSLYGKTAQAKRGGRYPAYQSYVWAGMITAGTRAKLLDAIAPNRDSVIACATDGVIFAEDPHIQQGKGLGEWECKSYDELLYLQAGVYFCNGHGINKTRGHILADLHYEEILKGWLQSGPNFEYSYTSRRFVGMGLANHLNDFTMWCDWIDFPRTLRCRPPGKVPVTKFTYDYEGDGSGLWEFVHDAETYRLRCMPTTRKEELHSAMFTKFDIQTPPPIDRIDDYLIAKEQPAVPTLF